MTEQRLPEPKEKCAEPNCWVGAYVLHLYCDHRNTAHDLDEFPHEYSLDSKAEAMRAARTDGWIIHRDGTATCPRCC